MNAFQFDAFARHMTTMLLRREMFSIVAAAAASHMAGGRRGALAACKKVGQKCDKNKECCDGARCQGDTKKKKGKCRCKSGRENCDGMCLSVDDDAHCGACGAACAEDQFCSDSACQACVPITTPFEPSAGSCSSDRECCGTGQCCTFNDVGGPVSSCFNLLTHTTACGTSCDTVVNCFNFDQICVNGECVDPPR